MLLQELCRRNLGWDEAITHLHSKQLSDWQKELQKVSELKVDCCIKPRDFGKPNKPEPIHFTDASQDGYLRLEKDNTVQVAFFREKPESPHSNRQQFLSWYLQLHFLLLDCYKLHCRNLFFWTDSATVLKYISNKTRRFHTFVR